jgi:hypothetical protein
MKRIGLIVLLHFILPLFAAAQNIMLKAVPEELDVYENQVFQVEYIIENTTKIDQFKASNFKGFEIVRPPMQGPSTSIQIINGHKTVKESLIITYTLRATKAGNYIISGVMATIDNKNYEANNITIRVHKNNNSYAQQNQNQEQQIDKSEIQKNIFIKVDINSKNPFLGQEVVATYKLYTKLPMTMSITQIPVLKGFWSEDYTLPKVPKPVEEIYNGEKYQVFILKKTALFPQQVGKLLLGSAEAEGNVRILEKSKSKHPFADHPMFSFFMDDPFFNNDFFAEYNYVDVPIQLKSNPVEINVKKLPLPQPNNFSGGVGKFVIYDSLIKKDYTTDDVIIYKVFIKGTGNPKLIDAPSINWKEELGVGKPIIIDSIIEKSPNIVGLKAITYFINPEKAGTYKIPAINYTYFNPNTQKYESITTEERVINIKEGNNSLKTAENNIINTHSNSSKKNWVITTSLILVLLICILIFSYIKNKKTAKINTHENLPFIKENTNLPKFNFETILTQIRSENISNQEFAEILISGIKSKISNHFQIYKADLSTETIIQKFSENNIDNEIINKTKVILNQLEMALYAPINNTLEKEILISRAEEIITYLDNKFK